jgi:hypothetical protein
LATEAANSPLASPGLIFSSDANRIVICPSFIAAQKTVHRNYGSGKQHSPHANFREDEE